MLNKTHIYSFIGTLLIIYAVHGQNTFNMYYPSGRLSFANKINYITADTFILSSYYVDSTSGRQGLDVKKLDSQGQELLRKRFLFRDDDYYSFLNNNVQTDISSSTMMLTAGTYVNNERGVIFTSVNKNTLDTNLARYHSDSIYGYYLNNVFKSKPNEVWFMGTVGNSNGYSTRPAAIKTDTLGNLLSIKEFTNLINYSSNIIYYDKNSNLIYMAGNTVINPAVQQSFVACTDTMGNVIWNQQLGNNPYTTEFTQIVTHNNYLLLSGFKVSNTSGSNLKFKLNLTKLNSNNGTTIWQKNYGREGMFNNLKALIINPDESIVTCGSMQHQTAGTVYNPNGIILKVNSAGDSLWLRSYSTYTNNTQEQFMDLQACADGGYMICGSPCLQNNCHSWLVKTDSMGIAPGIYTNTFVYTPPTTTTTPPGEETSIYTYNEENALFQIFPNPAIDRITVHVNPGTIQNNGSVENNLTLGIVDVNGREVRRVELGNKESDIELNGLSAGIYLLVIKRNNEVMHRTKLIKQE